MKVEHQRNGSLRIGIIGCLHGNELLGSEVIERLRIAGIPCDVKFVIANEEAIAAGKRFIDADLNRCFPGNPQGNTEERTAAQMLDELQDRELIIDIHSTTAETEGFIITVDDHAQRLVDALALGRVVRMPAQMAQGKSLIDHIPGLSLEYPRGTDPDELASVVLGGISGLLHDRVIGKEQFVGVTVLKGDAVLQNFEPLPPGQPVCGASFDFEAYPILSGEEAYPGVVGIICRKR